MKEDELEKRRNEVEEQFSALEKEKSEYQDKVNAITSQQLILKGKHEELTEQLGKGVSQVKNTSKEADKIELEEKTNAS